MRRLARPLNQYFTESLNKLTSEKGTLMIRRIFAVGLLIEVVILSLAAVYIAFAQEASNMDSGFAIAPDTHMTLSMVAILFSAASSVAAIAWSVKVLWGRVEGMKKIQEETSQLINILQRIAQDHIENEQIHVPKFEVMTRSEWHRECENMRGENVRQQAELAKEFTLKMSAAINELKLWIRDSK